MKKEKALAQIYKTMRQTGLTADDIKQYVLKSTKPRVSPKIADDFDLLCIIDGKKERVLFSDRQRGEVLAIFPFKGRPEYIELDEVENKKHTDSDVNTACLPDEQFCEQVYEIKNRLNACLSALGKPVLQGLYLADSSYMRGCGWIVGFDDNKTNRLSSDYYGGTTPAKLRYMGKFPAPKLRSLFHFR